MEHILINKEVLEFTKIIYVEVDGNDSNDGSRENPVASLAAAKRLASSVVSTSGTKVCIKFGNGRFEIDVLSDLNCKNTTFIGNCENTVIVVKRDGGGAHFSGWQCAVMRLIITVSDDYRSSNYGSYSDTSYLYVRYENVYFKRNSSGYLSSYHLLFTHNPSLANTTWFYNCHLDTARLQSLAKDVTYYNISATCSVVAGAATTTSLRAITDHLGHILDTGWRRAGTGENPDGSTAHIGLYGGKYAWGNWDDLCIIKQQDRYYVFNQDGSALEEVTDLNEEAFNRGCNFTTLNEKLDLLDDEFQLLFKKDLNVDIIGLESNSQLMVASNDFDTTISENVDHFKSNHTIHNNARLKIAFSIDKGVSWKSYNGNEFIDLNITIPIKEFSTLLEDELTNWNNTKESILQNGIDAATLQSINFNTLDFDTIRFAYVLGIDTITDKAANKELSWQFDSKGSMQQMKDTEYDLKLHSRSIEFKPLIVNKMIKVNVITNVHMPTQRNTGADESVYKMRSEIDELKMCIARLSTERIDNG